MTVYTFRTDAVDLLDRIANAPDLNTHANLMDELKEMHLRNATLTQQLAESNQQWAALNKRSEAVVEKFITDYNNDAEPLSVLIQGLADHFDIETSREIELKVTVEYSVWATVDRSVPDEVILDQLTVKGDLDFRLGVASEIDQSQTDFKVALA